MTGSSPYPPGFGAPPPGSGPSQGPSGPGYAPQQANFGPSTAPKRGRTGLLASGVVLAVVLGIAALVLSIISTIRGPEPSPPPQAPQADQQQLFVDGADREFCDAMGPLMRESSDSRNALQRSGAPNTPERKAAIPQFVKDSYDWGRRAQDLLNQYSVPPRFLTRNFQKYIDDAIMFAEGLSPTRDSSIYESQLYEFGVMDLAGLIGRCSEVDATPWWD